MVWIPTILCLLILMIAGLGSVSASPQLPCEFYGNVTISGSPAPVGTEITAYVNGAKQGTITVKQPGQYGGTGTFDERLIVLSGENDFTGGAPMITFKIGDKVADQTVAYTPGTSTEMVMSSGGKPVTVPVPAATTAPVVPMQVQSVPTQPVTIQTPVIPTVTTTVAPVKTPVSSPVVPVVTSSPVQAPVSAPVIPVVTATPVITAIPMTQGPSMMSVSTSNQTNSSQSAVSQPTNKTISVQTTLAPVVQTPVVPVITASPVGTVKSVSVNQTPLITPVQTPAMNQTNQSNVNKTPAMISNSTAAVSFPSGQMVTK